MKLYCHHDKQSVCRKCEVVVHVPRHRDDLPCTDLPTRAAPGTNVGKRRAA